MILAGDVGGTKTLLRCVDDAGNVVREERYESGAYATFDAMVAEFLASAQERFDAACFAVAGPVYDGRAEVTNVGWKLDEQALARQFKIPHVALINDFFAIAVGVPLLRDEDLITLNAGTRAPDGPIGILGAGTGLGEAVLVPNGDSYLVVPTEGGHTDFAPQNEEQSRLLLHLFEKYGEHVSWERVVSGMGLVNIFTFLGGSEEEPARIAELAGEGDRIAMRTMEMFVDAYGAEAGNMALGVLARGGVFLAGGIAAKNRRWFTDGAFRAAFVRKGRFRSLLETIPVHLIVNERVGVIGAAEWAGRAATALRPGSQAHRLRVAPVWSPTFSHVACARSSSLAVRVLL
ncbi:MAG TPA: glucokinase [Thermoanaerobaculia bacterium]|nr:glucokinase [Thermoanaerobaculia bacterium]